MVYSTELGYDPEEWEECPEPDHFLAFGFFTRIWLSVLTVVLSVMFFWMLESKKHWNNKPSDEEEVDERKLREKEVLRRNTLVDPFNSNPLADYWPQIVEETQRSRAASGNTTPRGPRRSSKKPLTAEEVAAMQVWERQLHEVAESRLRESQEHDSEDLRQVPDDWGNLLRDIQRLKVSECATPPSTPPQGAPSLEAHYRQMAHDLEQKLLKEIRDGESFKIDTPPNSVAADVQQRKLTEQLQQRYEEDINRAVQQLQKEHAEELGNSNLGQELRRKLESQIEGVVRQHSHGLNRQENVDRDAFRPRSNNEDVMTDHPKPREQGILDNNTKQKDDVIGGQENPHFSQMDQEYHETRDGKPTNKPSAAFYDEESVVQQHKKGSSSSDEGFVKVDREDADPIGPPQPVSKRIPSGHQSEEPELLLAPSNTLEEWGYQGSDSGGISNNSPGPRISIEIDDTTTADDIEFVSNGKGQAQSPGSRSSPYVEMLDIDDSQEALNSPQVVVIPDTLDNQYFKDLEKRQEVIDYSQPSNLDANEEEQVLKLLQEYELGASAMYSSKRPEEIALESPSGFDVVQLEQPKRPESELESRKVKDIHLMSSKSDDKSPYEDVDVKQKDGKVGAVETTGPLKKVVLSDETKKQSVNTQKSQKSPVLSRQMPVFEIEESYDEERQKVDEYEKKEQVFISDGALDEDPQRLVQAEIFLQDAMDFMETQQPRAVSSTGGFVMEEEMLESDKQPVPASAKALAFIKDKQGQSSEKDVQNASADPTSRLIKTNEVFEKPEPIFDDADDAVTYAPEIQSLEIPPDQLSENSLNLVENFSEHHELPATTQDTKQDAKIQPQMQDQSQKIQEKMLKRSSSPRMETSRTQAAPKAPMFLRQRNDGNKFDDISTSSISSSSRSMHKQSSLLSALGVTSTQEMLLKLPSLDALSDAMRRAGLESTNLIFGIDYTASNKYQGEHSFKGKSLHSIQNYGQENPYQQVIKIMGRTLAPFATSNGIPVYGFGDSTTGDWSVFALNGSEVEECSDLDEVLRVYNEVTPQVDLSGPTNFAPLIYKALSLCEKNQDYHILVIIADGQVTNERATRKAIVSACQFPLSIIVVGVGDGPWDMMKVFDESLPKRPWDNFHFVEFHELINERTQSEAGELDFAIHSLLEVPDQYEKIKQMGLLLNSKRLLCLRNHRLQQLLLCRNKTVSESQKSS
uniref:VWFA domain-containing protein n=1 Tax=Ditylenchus dipsaci TaxID=166011 RepID=A0A915EK25_9BILA